MGSGSGHGLTYTATLLYVILPQAVRLTVPPLTTAPSRLPRTRPWAR